MNRIIFHLIFALFFAIGSLGIMVAESNGPGSWDQMPDPPCGIVVIKGCVQPFNNQPIGLIDLHPERGTPPYTYQWDSGISSTTNTATGLGLGVYCATVTDAVGCSTVTCQMMSNPCNSDTEITIVKQMESAPGASDGAINITHTGGTAPVAFLWSTNAQTEDLTNVPGESRNYYLTILNANGCDEEFCVSLDTDCQPPLTVFENIQDDLGTGNGSIDLTVTGGAEPYFFEWSNGDIGNTIGNLFYGTYCVTITDTNGCKKNHCSQISLSGCALNAGLFPTEIRSETGEGANNGSIKVDIIAAKGPFNFQWSNGVSGNTSSQSLELTGLSTGNYGLTVSDAYGCVYQTSIPVGFGCPQRLDFLISREWASASGADDGTMSVIPGVGKPPYTFIWNTGTTTQTITALGGQEYCVTLTDSRGCTDSACVNMGFQCYDMQINGIVQNDTSGTGNAWVQAVPQFGNEPYTYNWDNGETTAIATGLVAGPYDLTVNDANGCDAFKVFIVNEDDCQPGMNIEARIFKESEAENDGEIVLTVAEGTQPYVYEWTGGITTQDITGLSAGKYCFTVTDAKGCKQSACYFVERQGCHLPAPLFPMNNAFFIEDSTSFSWTLQENADHQTFFEIQVATGTDFTDIVFSELVAGFQSTPPNPLDPGTKYYWRVRIASFPECWSKVSCFYTHFGNCQYGNGFEHCPFGEVDLFFGPQGGFNLISFNPAAESGVDIEFPSSQGFEFDFWLGSIYGSPEAILKTEALIEYRPLVEAPIEIVPLSLQALTDSSGNLSAIQTQCISGTLDSLIELTHGITFVRFGGNPQCVPELVGSIEAICDTNTLQINAPVQPTKMTVRNYNGFQTGVFFDEPVDFSNTEGSFLANGFLMTTIIRDSQTGEIISPVEVRIPEVKLTTQNLFDLTVLEEKAMFSDHFITGTGESLLVNDDGGLLVGDAPLPPVGGIKGIKLNLDSVTKVMFCLDRESMPQPFGDSLIAKVVNPLTGNSMDLIIRKTNGPNKLLRVDFSDSGSTQALIETFKGGVQQTQDMNANPAFWLSLISKDPDKIIAGIDENTSEFYYECIWNDSTTIQINEGPTVTIDKLRIQDVNGALPELITETELEMKGNGNLKFEKITTCRDARLIGNAKFEGPYDPNEDMMANQKAFDGLLPDADPFGLGENMFPGIDPTGQNGPDAIVDWIRIDMRDPENPDSILHSKAGFVRRDGVIVDANGIPGIRFPGIEQREYLPSVNGAGHLTDPGIQGIIFSPFGNSCGEAFIFYSSAGSSSNSSPGGPGGPGNPGGNLVSGKPGPVSNPGKTLVNGVWVITSGDTNNDGVIDSADRSETWNFRNQSGYLNQDVNWDGVVDSADRSMIWNNRNQSSQLTGN